MTYTDLKRQHYAEAKERILYGIADQEDHEYIDTYEQAERMKRVHVGIMLFIIIAVFAEGLRGIIQ